MAKDYLLLFLPKFLRLSRGNIAEMTSHGFNKLCIVKAFNRKMKIHIAWQSRKNRMLVRRVRLIIKLIAMSQQLLRMTSRVKFSEDMMRI